MLTTTPSLTGPPPVTNTIGMLALAAHGGAHRNDSDHRTIIGPFCQRKTTALNGCSSVPFETWARSAQDSNRPDH